MPSFILLIMALFISSTLTGRPQFPDEINEIIKHVHDTCVGNTGVAEEDIANCEKGIFKDDRKLKCYMYCILEEASIGDEDGNVDYDLLISMIPEEYSERVAKMINACRHLDTPGQDKCDKTFEGHKCTYTQDPEFYFLL